MGDPSGAVPQLCCSTDVAAAAKAVVPIRRRFIMIAKPHFIYPPGKGVHSVCEPTGESDIEIHPVRGILLKGVKGTEAVMTSGYSKLEWVVASNKLFLQRSSCGSEPLMGTGILREYDRAYH